MKKGEPRVTPGRMAEKEPLVGSPQPPYRSITPGRIRLGDGVPERTATKPKPQPQPEPEPEYEANPRTPGVPSSPGLASFGSLVSDVQSGYSEVIITSRLGWTQQKDQHSMHVFIIDIEVLVFDSFGRCSEVKKCRCGMTRMCASGCRVPCIMGCAARLAEPAPR